MRNNKNECGEYPILRLPDQDNLGEEAALIKKKHSVVKFGNDEHIPPENNWEDDQIPDDGEESAESNFKQYVIIDVGGERYQAGKDLFTRYPNTRLGKLVNSSDVTEILTLCEEFVPGQTPEFFFDRNPECFGAVLEMYRSGKFHIPDSGKGNDYCS